MTPPEPSAAPRRRGRPTDVDPERVALLALRHFDEHGYEQTTMDDIARVAGIGRRTLFRYFPSKPALVWGGLEPVVGRMNDVLEAAGDDEPVRDVLARAVGESLTLTPEAEEATRRRLALMGTHPALIGFGLTAIAANRDILAGFLARRLGADVQSLRVQVLSDAIGSADFSALLWWARNGGGSPAEVVVTAMDEVLRGV
ncbi:TetR family transcriptional regulator [Leifsonia sp. fls2-241-R2A-40a]|uniref:acyl-CoA-like ligand-binding transcription factor n=1 Tax=Leifsonia sp. fls2-241-R2A-40a TaxID=3040290 RepID=UPI00254C3333|nr:TetR family transcriptional regulator [Leifsonia sp. fls2-241-R2A-40a]